MDTRISVPLRTRTLTSADLPSCTWAGTNTHLAYVARALERANRGEVDYLAVCGPPGSPLAIGGIDYTARPHAGTLWQLVVHPALRSCGLGTVLITAAEKQIVRRGLRWAELSVEEDDTRASAFYERLEYAAYGRDLDSWLAEDPCGSVRTYECVCILMRKCLSPPSTRA